MQKKKVVYATLGSILSVLVIVAYLYIFNNFKNKEEILPINYDFTIVADSYDSTGIDLNSGFIITSKEDFNLASVKDIIKVYPEIDYDLTKSGAGSYYLKPKNDLIDNSIFNILVDTDNNAPSNSWAFQTKTGFNVLSSLPANNSVVTELNSGIQINFSKKIEKLDGYFSISPEVDGNFIYAGKSATFVPNAKLQDKEQYTIILKAGLKSIDGDILDKDYTFAFETEEYIYSSKNIFLRDKTETFNTKNTQLIALAYGQNNYEGVDFNVCIYDLLSSKNYLDLCKKEEIIDTNKYTLKTSFKSNLLYPENDYTNTAYIVYPENLPIGWYLVDITTSSGIPNVQHLQQLIQVTDISVYMQSMNGQALIWCNDATTGLPLVNSQIKIGKNSVKTNENGVAIFKVDGKQDVLISTSDGKQFANVMDFESNWEETNYNIYLFTDRESYKPTDTINFWGMIMPQDTKYKLPKEIDLYFNNDELILSNISVNSNGVFTGSIEIENRISEYVSLIVKFDNEEYYTDYIVIEEYIKPTYILDFSFDKEYYKKNDIADISIEASYFDGNPANNLQLNLGIGSTTESIELNAFGQEKIKYAFNNIDKDNWYPQTIYATLYTSGADENTFKDKSVLYFPTNYMIDTEIIDNELIINTNVINYNNVDPKNIDYKKIKGAAQSGVYGQIKFYRNYYIRNQIGTYYDFINKVNKPKYEYKTEKILIDTVGFTTDDNGIAKVPMSYENTEDYYCTYEIEYNMPDYFKGIENRSIGSYYIDNDYSEYYYFDTGYKQLKNNEEVLIKIESNKVFNNQGKVLYVVLNDEIQEAAVTQNNQFSLKYNEKYVPDVLLIGAYFDGNNVHPINSSYLVSDVADKKLDIKITTDKESYAPGDSVTVNVEAKDIYGKAAKTNMVIAVVDEAAFAVNNQNEYPLNSLYSFDYYNPVTYFSYNPHTFNPGGGEGGGGDGEGSYRDYFRDTVAFLTIKTGSNGKTSASFKLPDNITSWRITSIGITDNFKAGVGTTNIITTLPFYANVVMNEKYNIKDDISLTLKSSGEYLPLLSSSIQYNVKLIKDEELITSEKAYQLPFKSINVNMGKVTEPGNYKIEIKAECGVYNDTIVKDFVVVNSLHEINIAKNIELKDLASLEVVKYPVTLSLYDVNNKKYYDIASKIFNTSLGTTTDQKIAYNALVKKLNEINGNDYLQEVEIKKLQDYDGGIRLLEYGESETLLTAKICAVAPEVIDKYNVINYFENIINDKESDSSEVSAAYFGLATLKQPVLNDIKYLLENNKGFSLEDNLNLIAGLAYIGDNATANEWYAKLIESRLKEDIETGVKYLNLSDDYENYKNTSFLTMILAKINHEDFNMVSNYIVQNTSKEYTPAIDLIGYIKEYNPKTDSVGFVKYNYNDEETIEDFKESNTLVLQLNEKNFKNFNIVEANNVTGNVRYIGTIDEAADNYENNLQITKTITEESNIGDVRTVTLTIKIPSGTDKNEYFVINDIIPNGMRFVGVENFYNYKKDSQKIQFYISNNSKKTEYTIRYNIRNILEGEYAVESAIVTNPNTREIGFSVEDTIVVESL